MAILDNIAFLGLGILFGPWVWDNIERAYGQWKGRDRT